jgi:glycosyltransferase involved in cell wall biosynthesis
MRVLVVSNLYPPVVRGGYELECAEVVARLARRDEVLVLTSTVDREFTSTVDRVLTSTVDRDQSVPDSFVRRELDLMGSGPRGALVAPLSTLRALRTMRRTLEHFKPDVAYVWNGADLPHALFGVLADSEIPIVFRVCEQWLKGLFVEDQFMRYLNPGHRGARRAWAELARAINRVPALRLNPVPSMVAAISWNSQAVRDQTGVPAMVRPVLERVIYPTTRRVDELRGLERKPDPAPRIAFLGRLETFKGPDVAVRAIAVMRREHGLVARLTLAGSGPVSDRRRLEDLARAEGVSDLVDLPGALDRAGVEDLLSRVQALVVPSVWEEPFGMVAIEGAAAGVPVVASDVGGISEGLHDKEHALLFPSGDAIACASALVATLRDTEATTARVKRALERSLDFGLESYLDAAEGFLEDAIRVIRDAGVADDSPVRSGMR